MREGSAGERAAAGAGAAGKPMAYVGRVGRSRWGRYVAGGAGVAGVAGEAQAGWDGAGRRVRGGAALAAAPRHTIQCLPWAARLGGNVGLPVLPRRGEES